MTHHEVTWEKIHLIRRGDIIETKELGRLEVIDPHHLDLGVAVTGRAWGRRLLVSTTDGTHKLLEVLEGSNSHLKNLDWERELEESPWRTLWAS